MRGAEIQVVSDTPREAPSQHRTEVTVHRPERTRLRKSRCLALLPAQVQSSPKEIREPARGSQPRVSVPRPLTEVTGRPVEGGAGSSAGPLHLPHQGLLLLPTLILKPAGGRGDPVHKPWRATSSDFQEGPALSVKEAQHHPRMRSPSRVTFLQGESCLVRDQKGT